MTRRPIEPQPRLLLTPIQGSLWATTCNLDGLVEQTIRCPYGVPGDRLWVREEWWDWAENKSGPRQIQYDVDRVVMCGNYIGGDPKEISKAIKMSASSMPRWASRITLEITNVRVERVQKISEADAKAEGIVSRIAGTDGVDPIQMHRTGFVYEWNLRAPVLLGWCDNPWVWVVEFQRMPQPPEAE